MIKELKKNFPLQLALITSLFFLWAFLHNINPILIPHLKKACQLSDTQSSFIDISVYLAYFLTALPAGWAMHKFGYKKGIIIGLVLYAAGALLVIPAAAERSYAFFLLSFFIIATGATFLETVANPYVAILGPRGSSEQRLNFAQSFNGVGAFLAPILGGKFILTGIEHTAAETVKMKQSGRFLDYLQSEANTVKIPYLIIAGVVLFLILLFVFTPIPEINEEDTATDHHLPGSGFTFKVLKNRHLAWAVVAQFFYVGAQVGVGSFFIRYARYVADMNEKEAAYLWGSIAMVGFMAGRFIGTFIMRYFKPAKLLSIYAAINIILLIVAVTSSKNTALYAVVAVPFFMSIMYPTIFALGIKGLGAETKIGASLLVMSIIGGAFAPLCMGLVSDATGSIQRAYWIPLLCFSVILYYAVSGYKVKSSAVSPELLVLKD
jgi:FHS family L-fucose permease-like MFS transporter